MRRTFALWMLAGLLVLPGVARAQSDGSDQVADPSSIQVAPADDTSGVDTGGSAPADSTATDDTAPAVNDASAPLLVPFVQATMMRSSGGPLMPDPSKPLASTSSPLVTALWHTPSPVGAPLFFSYDQGGGPNGAQGTTLWVVPAGGATYQYTCAAGQCTGSAQDVWCAMPSEQQAAYLSNLVQVEGVDTNPRWKVAKSLTVSVGKTGSGLLGTASMTPPDPTVTYTPRGCAESPAPARVAPSPFDLSASPARYLAAVRGLPSTLYNFRYQFDTRLQSLRLGADTRDRLSSLLPRLSDASTKLNSNWQQIVPPPNLATVHQYALAAVAEADAGVQLTLSSFNAGGSSIPASAAAHFDNSDQLIAAALDAIDVAAGP